jgi:hypothetical protein
MSVMSAGSSSTVKSFKSSMKEPIFASSLTFTIRKNLYAYFTYVWLNPLVKLYLPSYSSISKMCLLFLINLKNVILSSWKSGIIDNYYIILI